MSIELGIARADITPPAGISMVGFAARGPSTAIHDPLTATAMALREGDRAVVLFCLDLLDMQAATVGRVREAVSARTDVRPEDVIVACAHNHFGPNVDRARDDPMVDAYREYVTHVLAGLAAQALEQGSPAHMGVAWGQSDIGVNRRERRADGQIVLGKNPGGPVDRAVGVARFEAADGRPVATLVNFACHPVCQTSHMRAVSADFPGAMRDVVERLTGAPCLLLQGASGNINPVIMEPEYEAARTLGTRLGCAVVETWERTQVGAVSGLGCVAGTAKLPRYSFGSAEHAQRLQSALEQEIVQRREEGNPGRLEFSQRRLERVKAAVAAWESGEPQEPLEAEVTALHIGDLAVATAPGEVFNEIGQQIKAASPYPNTFFAGYVNGSIGYVPVPEAYAEGGYEVERACQVDPEAAAMLTAACTERLQQLRH